MSRNPQRRIYILDTSVLVHDPTALFSFDEHHICIPGAVLEELDAAKQGLSEVARNARQTSRFLDQLLTGHAPSELTTGIPLGTGGPGQATGRLFFATEDQAPGDAAILAAARKLNSEQGDYEPVLVSKDINLRIRAQISGITAEDYESDRVIDDVDLLPTGVEAIPGQTWEKAHHEGNQIQLPIPAGAHWRLNQCLYHEPANFAGIIRSIADGYALLTPLREFCSGQSVWGIQARNREQNFALNLLMDPTIDLVTLLGSAGTGKTLLTLAAGLSQTMDENRYREVIATRATVAIGEEIGYLPGTEEEKMTPWMGALMDNLEVLASPTGNAHDWGRAATADLLHSRVRIRSLSFMRGRTFLDKFVILDEAQNLTAKQMKALITRAGPGTKIVCLGNIGQIDTPYLTASTSGLTYVVDRLKDWSHSGHVTLQRGERSRLADYASEVL